MMKRSLAAIQRLLAYLLRPPAILASADTRMVLTPDRTTLAVALHGWGWIAISPADEKPRWHDWRFFGRSCAHLVVPPGPRARISAINVFGRRATLWHRPITQRRLTTVALAPASAPTPGLRAPQLPQLCTMPVRTPPRLPRPQFDLRHLREVAGPAVPTLRMVPHRTLGSTPALSPKIWDRMTRCGQLARNAAMCAAAAVNRTNSTTRQHNNTNDNTNNRVDKWDRTK